MYRVQLQHKKDSMSVSKRFNSPVGNVGDGKDVGRHLVPLLPLVDLNDLLSVDGQPLVRVHHHTEQARVRLVERCETLAILQQLWQNMAMPTYIYQARVVSLFDVVQHRSLVEAG